MCLLLIAFNDMQRPAWKSKTQARRTHYFAGALWGRGLVSSHLPTAGSHQRLAILDEDFVQCLADHGAVADQLDLRLGLFTAVIDQGFSLRLGDG